MAFCCLVFCKYAPLGRVMRPGNVIRSECNQLHATSHFDDLSPFAFPELGPRQSKFFILAAFRKSTNGLQEDHPREKLGETVRTEGAEGRVVARPSPGPWHPFHWPQHCKDRGDLHIDKALAEGDGCWVKSLFIQVCYFHNESLSNILSTRRLSLQRTTAL
jgi:hypothetical protein